MGTDDLFRKRKYQKATDLARRAQARPQGLRYLIVCEGGKTEPNYFRELCADLRLKTARVRVEPGEYGSSPGQVVKYAESVYEDDAKGGDAYDKIFCVFDRDTHADFQPALKRIRELANEKKPFEAIVSIPCFEYWLLLHFRPNRQGFHAAGKKSVCDAVIRELRQKPGLKKYAKGENGIYGKIKDKAGDAVKYAIQAEKDAETTGEMNPSTRIHALVTQLLELAREARRK